MTGRNRKKEKERQMDRVNEFYENRNKDRDKEERRVRGEKNWR